MTSKLEEWALTDRRKNQAISLRGLYETMAAQLYGQYEPTRMAYQLSRKFLRRVEAWLDCFDAEADKWSAFRSLEYLLFAGQSEFDELYRHVAENIIKPWLIDDAGADLFDPNIDNVVDDLFDQCWICPATDSLRINAFLHVSCMRGKPLRPDWHSLRELGSADRIKEFVQDSGVKYLIILEDFVGTGSQLARAVRYAATVFEGPILAVPLIICAPGHEKMQITSEKLPNVEYLPGLVLEANCLVGKEAVDGEPKLFPQLRKAMKAGYEKIRIGLRHDLDGNELGYKGTGSLVVLYSNCPNNTPPIFHCDSRTWVPLFPRSTRY